MLNELDIRNLLEVLKRDNQRETNALRVAAFSGGISALQMVLEEED